MSVYPQSFFQELVEVLKWPGEKPGAASGTPTAMLQQIGTRPGDYVILPNLSPLYWAEAVKAVGADCLLIDHHPDHWQLDLDLLEEFLMNFTMLNERDELILKKDKRIVRTLIVPHLLGGMCDMDRLSFIAHRFNLAWGEDISRALGSSWKDRPAGTFGSINYLDLSANPFLPFEASFIFSTDKNRLSLRGTTRQSLAALSDHSPNRLLAQVPSKLEGLRQLEAACRRADQKHQLRWMNLLPESQSNGQSAAFMDPRGINIESLPTGRLRPPIYQTIPFDKSLYIRREDHSARLFAEARLLPIRTEGKRLVEKMKLLLQGTDSTA